ncbi:MAG: nucleotidyltransferase domain-containing protein, partial [Candidatus Aegiribacteria sp.]|nr:nucleotidyltransferase domain-containing protein [Candidatus Aegiribacteria sp.]
LRKLNPFLKELFGIESLGVFGSVARNEAGKNSDVNTCCLRIENFQE